VRFLYTSPTGGEQGQPKHRIETLGPQVCIRLFRLRSGNALDYNGKYGYHPRPHPKERRQSPAIVQQRKKKKEEKRKAAVLGLFAGKESIHERARL